jgi:hypothetical protein
LIDIAVQLCFLYAPVTGRVVPGKRQVLVVVKAAEGRYMLLFILMGKSMNNFLLKLGIAVNSSMPLLILWQLFSRFFSFWLPIPAGLLLYQNLRRY